VLLLHGGPGMTDYLESLLPELDGYRVASFQQRGVEPSTLAGPFDVPTLRDDVIDVLDALDWAAPTIIGHSWGGHLDELEKWRPLTQEESLEAMALAWPGYFSSLEVAQPISQRGHAPSAETWASIEAELPALPDKLRGCAVPTRFVHGELDPLPVSASAETAEVLGATVDVLPGNGHFPWLEDPGCVRRSLDLLRAASAPRSALGTA
jgi:pimeloyl-ACP methyl ester carboxylesterase